MCGGGGGGVDTNDWCITSPQQMERLKSRITFICLKCIEKFFFIVVAIEQRIDLLLDGDHTLGLAFPAETSFEKHDF